MNKRKKRLFNSLYGYFCLDKCKNWFENVSKFTIEELFSNDFIVDLYYHCYGDYYIFKINYKYILTCYRELNERTGQYTYIIYDRNTRREEEL